MSKRVKKVPLTIRLSPPAYRWLKKAAAESKRTLSGQIEYLLFQWALLAGPAPEP